MVNFTSRPAKGRLIQGYGPRPKPTPTSPAIHYGQDYSWGGGDPIYAVAPGTVVEYASRGAYGNRLTLRHSDGTQTWYCHLNSSRVKVGSQVNAGDWIANMGSTGNVTGKHLHFEYRVNGGAVDPEPYFRGTTQAGGGITPIDNDIEEPDMDAEQNRKLNEVWSLVGTIKQILAEENQWQGMDPRLTATYKAVGEIRQSIFETEQWEGIDARITRIAREVEELADTVEGLKFTSGGEVSAEIDYDRIINGVADALSQRLAQ